MAMSNEDETCGDYPLAELSPQGQAMELAQTMDRLSKVDLLTSWCADTFVHAFSHASNQVRLSAIYIWATALNIQVRDEKPEWSNRMLLWDKLDCLQEMKAEVGEATPDEIAEIASHLNDAMQIMNFAGEGQMGSAVSLAAVRCRNHSSPHQSFAWWMGLVVGLGHFSSHVGTDAIVPVVSAYVTDNQQSDPNVAHLIGGDL